MAAVSYPLLEEPLPPGLVTIDGYAATIGRTPGYLLTEWLPRPGFPEPVGELPGRGRNGGGRRPKVYREAALAAFRASQPDLQGQGGRKMTVTGVGPDERVTLGFFADHAEWEGGGRPSRRTVTQYQGRPGFPGAGPDRRYRSGDLIAFFNSRPDKRGPAPRAAGKIVTSLGPDERVTLGFFADHSAWEGGGRPTARPSRGTGTRRASPPPGTTAGTG